MRFPILATALSLSLAGCLVGNVGPRGSGDDDDVPGPGSDPDPGPGPGPDPATPSVTISVDQTALSTELLTTNLVTVTARGSGGFSGPVTLSASVVDPGGAAMPRWTVAFDNATINVPQDGTAAAVATLKIPSDSSGLAATVRFDASSSAGPQTASSAINVANQMTYSITLNNGQCVYPAAGVQNVRVGTKVRWVNRDAAARVTIHMDRTKRDGLVHQDDPGSAPGAAYELVTAVNDDGQLSGAPMSWYCHAPGPDTGSAHQLKVVP